MHAFVTVGPGVDRKRLVRIVVTLQRRPTWCARRHPPRDRYVLRNPVEIIDPVMEIDAPRSVHPAACRKWIVFEQSTSVPVRRVMGPVGRTSRPPSRARSCPQVQRAKRRAHERRASGNDASAQRPIREHQRSHHVRRTRRAKAQSPGGGALRVRVTGMSAVSRANAARSRSEADAEGEAFNLSCPTTRCTSRG